MDNLISRLSALEERLGIIPTNLGVPQRRHFLIRLSKLEGNTRVYTDTLIYPPPHISKVPTNYIDLPLGNGGIAIEKNDYIVHLSRTREKPLFLPEGNQTRAEFYIDPPVYQELITGEWGVDYTNPLTKSLAGGIKCSLIDVDDKDLTLWKLILRAEVDK